MLQSERLLFIHKARHEKVIPVYTLTFCITKPVDKKVKMVIFTEPAPTPIQSSSRNVHYKDEVLKPLWVMTLWLIQNIKSKLQTLTFSRKMNQALCQPMFECLV